MPLHDVTLNDLAPQTQARHAAVREDVEAHVRDWPERGEIVRDQSFLLLFNANREPVMFTVPDRRFGPGWDVLISTATAAGTVAAGGAWPPAGTITVPAGRSIELAGRSIMVLRSTEGGNASYPR